VIRELDSSRVVGHAQTRRGARPSPEVVPVLGEDRIFDRLAEIPSLALAQRMQLVESLDEQQRGHLRDHFQRVRDAARPEVIPDPVDLGLQLSSDHCGGPLP
jgi:hypothetical protein